MARLFVPRDHRGGDSTVTRFVDLVLNLKLEVLSSSDINIFDHKFPFNIKSPGFKYQYSKLV